MTDPIYLRSFNTKLLKVVLQILGRKVYKNPEKSSLYSQSLLIFINKTPVVESPPTAREIRDLLRPRSTPKGNTVYFLHEHLAENTQYSIPKIITFLLCYGNYALLVTGYSHNAHFFFFFALNLKIT